MNSSIPTSSNLFKTFTYSSSSSRTPECTSEAASYERSGQLRDDAILQSSRLGTTESTELGADKIADPETAASLRQRQEIRT